MHNFTAIDFETANPDPWSICQVGLVRIEKGIVAKEISLLVQPPNNFYWDKFIEIHGIGPNHTACSPTFDKIWTAIEPYISGQTVVAHNGPAFDFRVLGKTLGYYGMVAPDYQKHCTYKIYGSNLASLCRSHHIELNHHDALSDARACARLFLMHLNTI
ncbi:MAG TPA: exonuclease domain-containing protein [Prolixibacteraceae bacterium]